MNPTAFTFDPTQQLNLVTKQYQEGMRAMLTMWGSMADSMDKQLADNLRAYGTVQEHVAASRRQGLKLVEEAMERSIAASQALMGNLGQVWGNR